MTVSELTSAQDQMVLLGRKTACEKIASFLLMLCDRAGGGESGEIAIPMTRADIADYFGLTTETVSRTFMELRRRGCIRLLGTGTMQLADRDELEDLAGG